MNHKNDLSGEMPDGTNKASHLFDGQYILKAYQKKIMAKFPEYASIKKITVEPHKNHVWEETYHVVIEYKICFEAKDGKCSVVSVYCSAHSSEPRKNVYDSLKFLWRNGFDDTNKNRLTVPRPLFYSKRFKGTFYVGAQGYNLNHYIKEKKLDKVEAITKRAAAWMAKLHSLPISDAWNFNKDNSRIKTVRPGMDNIFEKIKAHYPDFYPKYKEAYLKVYGREQEFLSSTKARWLVHGDAHPENIIKMRGGWTAMIDFSDLSLTDFARDLGSFLQQMDYKLLRYTDDKETAERIKKVFLEKYLKSAKIKMTDGLRERIDNYYDWTLLRTVAFFLIKHHPMPDRAEELFNTLHNKQTIC